MTYVAALVIYKMHSTHFSPIAKATKEDMFRVKK